MVLLLEKNHILRYSLAKSTVLVIAEQVVASGSAKKIPFSNFWKRRFQQMSLKKIKYSLSVKYINIFWHLYRLQFLCRLVLTTFYCLLQNPPTSFAMQNCKQNLNPQNIEKKYRFCLWFTQVTIPLPTSSVNLLPSFL